MRAAAEDPPRYTVVKVDLRTERLELFLRDDTGVGFKSLERLEAWIVAGNDTSIDLVEGLGFTREATLQQRYLHAGKRRDVHVLAHLSST